jgi:hypothetical protein
MKRRGPVSRERHTRDVKPKMPRTVEVEWAAEEDNSRFASGKRKRRLDKIDVRSKQMNYTRSRFTPKERDMLILIRAVGFFLNPVHRFWMDPGVMRDVMHEFVPESRSKTVSCLMAASVREMSRQSRIAHLQYLVRTLCSFPEMREKRSHLATTNFQDSDQKREFFLSAFRSAYQLLFDTASQFPSATSSDDEFAYFISSNNYAIGQSDMSAGISFPTRSLKPMDIDHIQHCVAYNVLMAMLLNEEETPRHASDSEAFETIETMIEHISAHALSEVMERLRSDGLISRLRNHLPSTSESTLSFRNHAAASVYYRHFFNHRYHNNLIDLTKSAAFGSYSADEEDPGLLVALTSYLYDENVCALIKYYNFRF